MQGRVSKIKSICPSHPRKKASHLIQIAICISARHGLEKTNSILSKVYFIATKILTNYVGCWKTGNMSYVSYTVNWYLCNIISFWIFTILLPHFEVLTLKHLLTLMVVVAADPQGPVVTDEPQDTQELGSHSLQGGWPPLWGLAPHYFLKHSKTNGRTTT